MFLGLLEMDERFAFLALAKKVIFSDQRIAQKEKVLFKAMQQEVEIMDDSLEGDVTEEDLAQLPDDIAMLCATFKSKKSQISALMELIGLGYVDGEFVQSEQHIIYEIAQHFDMIKEETDNYIEWASRLYT
jgi:uncharacterized tellurite resistance protein B-like protein